MSEDFEPSNLESILSGEQPELVSAEPVEEAADDTTEEVVDDADQAPVVTDDETDKKPREVPLDALIAERQKRQELEAQLKERESQEEAEKVSVFDDEEAYTKQISAEVDDKINKARVEMSVQLVKSQYDDFEEVGKVFAEEAEKDPTLLEKAVNSDNPALTAYNIGKHHQQLREIGDPATYKERIKQEILEEIKAEQAAEAKKQAKQDLRNTLPSDIANESGSNVPNDGWSGPTDLKSIMKGR